MTRAALVALVAASIAAAPARAGDSVPGPSARAEAVQSGGAGSERAAPGRPTPGRAASEGAASEGAAPASSDPGYRFARSLALAGPRPAGSAGERRANARVAARFRAAGLRVGSDGFRVPGHGRSRNVVGVWDAPADCLIVLLAHVDSGPAGPGADDNASGVGVLVALAPRLRALQPRCDVWLISTGAEERGYTGQPDHLGALAAVRRVRRLHRASDLRFALSLDEVGRGRTMQLRSPVPAQRAAVERPIVAAGRGTGLRVSWLRDSGTGNSDHREFELAGLPGAKLGVPDEPCRELACDRASRLDAGTFPRVRRLVERLLSG